MNSFTIPFSDLAGLRASEVPDYLAAHPRIKIGDLRVLDLIDLPDDPRQKGRGVYLYYGQKDQCLYVGKNSGGTFVERIPWHMATSDGSWMNHLMKRIRKHWGAETYREAAKMASDVELLLIAIPDPPGGQPEVLERFLRVVLKPEFNSFKVDRIGEYDTEVQLQKLVEERV